MPVPPTGVTALSSAQRGIVEGSNVVLSIRCANELAPDYVVCREGAKEVEIKPRDEKNASVANEHQFLDRDAKPS